MDELPSGRTSENLELRTCNIAVLERKAHEILESLTPEQNRKLNEMIQIALEITTSRSPEMLINTLMDRCPDQELKREVSAFKKHMEKELSGMLSIPVLIVSLFVSLYASFYFIDPLNVPISLAGFLEAIIRTVVALAITVISTATAIKIATTLEIKSGIPNRLREIIVAYDWVRQEIEQMSGISLDDLTTATNDLMKIRRESEPKRCEVCHQTDDFDPKTGYCKRCNYTTR